MSTATDLKTQTGMTHGLAYLPATNVKMIVNGEIETVEGWALPGGSKTLHKETAERVAAEIHRIIKTGDGFRGA